MATKGGCTNGETLRIVLLGKTGAGKSTLGNALTGMKAPRVSPDDKRDERPPAKNKDPNIGFKVGRGLKSETVFCDWSRGARHGTIVEVTDTPGLCDTHLPEKAIYKEVAKSVAVAEPGPNVIVFVLRCDRRFTEEEFQAYRKIKALFSDEMNNYLILVFNGMDAYEEVDSIEEQREILADEIKKYGARLDDMLKEAGHRFFGMNNKLSASDKERQVQDLISMMKDLVRMNGQNTYYRTEMTDQIMKKVEELAEEQATSKKVSRSQATVDVKKAIVSEEVKSSVWTSFVSVVSASAQKVKEGVQSMCSVM